MATYPFLTPTEVGDRLARNAAAAMVWRATPMDEKIRCYQRLASTLRDTSAALAMTAASEMGKTSGEARGEIEKCASALSWLATHGPAALADEPVESEGSDRIHVSFLPIGTVLGVMPWNFPFWQAMRAAGPIMLSGNGFLLKHAFNVMGCAFALEAAYEASGFPKGLFANLNVSTDVVADVIRDPRVAAVTVTGSKRQMLGGKIEGPGFFYEPTVLAGAEPGMSVFDEEVFGPVAAITIADNVEHAIGLANMSEYGLSGNLWTTDTKKAKEIAGRLETGGVFINGFSASNPRIPVGGVKKSGYGRELSHFGLSEFVNAQSVWIRDAAVRPSVNGDPEVGHVVKSLRG
jgi:acyl-CoA reductase-like NAD-dependent aldehyde dehydrogenase